MRFLISMNSLMLNKVWATILSIFFTLKGFHTCMNSLMCSKDWTESKSFPTFLTFMGLLTRMYSKFIIIVKGLFTFLKFIGFLTSRNFNVLNKVSATTKLLPTFLTFIWLICSMNKRSMMIISRHFFIADKSFDWYIPLDVPLDLQIYFYILSHL